MDYVPRKSCFNVTAETHRYGPIMKPEGSCMPAVPNYIRFVFLLQGSGGSSRPVNDRDFPAFGAERPPEEPPRSGP